MERVYRISLELIVPQIVSILWMSTRWSGLWSRFISHHKLVLETLREYRRFLPY